MTGAIVQRAAPADDPVAPVHARVGIVGGGQLARMTHAAAIPLAVDVEVLDPDRAAPAIAAGAVHRAGSPDRLADLRRLAHACDVLTLDHERVPAEHLEALEREGHVVRPGAASARAAQDKLHARTLLGGLGFPVPAFAPVRQPEDVAAFARAHGWPVVLKAVRGGYDGRGVRVARNLAEAGAALAAGGTWLVEEQVPIVLELAVLVARRPGGEAVAYPPTETVQIDGMCRELVAPAPVASRVADAARELALGVADAVDATGILAVELFVTREGLVVNELAARPHNSGHWTLDGSVTSQFENHLRAALDLPLGDPAPTAPAVAMVNVVGPADGSDPVARLPRALAIPGAHVHLYGKTARPGRKLGHVTATGADADRALATARAAARALEGLA